MNRTFPWAASIATCQVAVVCVTLLGSLTYQFALHDLPCPLCVVQRLAFLLACVGPIGIICARLPHERTPEFQARGFALCILASIVGVAASGRQILLHIVPPDAGYGPPVLGLHLYSWALIVFLCLIASSAVGLLWVNEKALQLPAATKVAALLAVGLGIAIA